VIALILSAGRATRMGDAAPGGVKALARLGGRTVLERQVDMLVPRGWDPHLVTREPVAAAVPNVVVGEHAGPGHALALALEQLPKGLGQPLLVVYADTLWDFHSLPGAGDWIGTSREIPSYRRRWDVVDAAGRVAYRFAKTGDRVAVGLYSFRYLRTVQSAAAQAVRASIGGEVGMADVLAYYPRPVPPHRIDGWVDVGDADALARADKEYAS